MVNAKLFCTVFWFASQGNKNGDIKLGIAADQDNVIRKKSCVINYLNLNFIKHKKPTAPIFRQLSAVGFEKHPMQVLLHNARVLSDVIFVPL